MFQLTVLTFEFTVLPNNVTGHHVVTSAVSLVLADPPAQRLWRNTKPQRPGLNTRPLAVVLAQWSATNRTARALNSSSYLFGMMRNTFPRMKVCIKPGVVQPDS